MRYLKTYELFDTKDLKSQFEIPYLKGDLDPSEISKWKNLKDELDTELNRIVNDVPWLVELKYRRSGSVLSIGFDNHIIYDKSEDGREESVFYYFLIEIVKFRDEYSLNVYAKCHGNGQQIYSESIIKKAMPYSEMISQLKRPTFNLLIDFNNFIENCFGESHFSIKDKNTLVINPLHN